MDRAITLAETVRQEVRSYATNGYNLAGQRVRLLYVENPEDQVFAVLSPFDPGDNKAELVIMARIVDDKVFIDFNKTDRPLENALKRAGIPEDQIVVAWAAEKSGHSK